MMIIIPPIISAFGRLRFASLSFGVDGGRDYPALIGKGGRADGSQQRRADASGDSAGREVALEHMRRAYKADDDADHCHQEQRDKLYNGGRGLELSGKLGGERIHDICADEVEHHQRKALGPDDAAALGCRDYHWEIRPAGGDEHEGVARGEP